MSPQRQEIFLMKNKGTKSTLTASRPRKLSAPLIVIDENRDNLDQRIKKFHQSLLAYKREKDEEDDVFDEGDQEGQDFSDSVPELPDIKPNTSRSKSLARSFPKLSQLSNLNLKSSSDTDVSLDDLRECRYLRIPDQAVELSVDEIFEHEKEIKNR
jgi:hypothetical protein